MSDKTEKIVIAGMGSISPLGHARSLIWRSYSSRVSRLKPVAFDGQEVAAAKLSAESDAVIDSIRNENSRHAHLDRTVLMAIHSAREAVREAGWKEADKGHKTGVNIGSSRGATGILEDFHAAYLTDAGHRVPPLTSPVTTLGNISSSIAHDIGASGPEISHSVTCSTALQAVFNAIAWMRSGLADRFIVGGAEAALTGFTVAQMRALRIYTNDTFARYPSRPCSSEPHLRDMMALGEGAALFALEKLTGKEMTAKRADLLGVIESFGYGLEYPRTATAITEEGYALRQAMRMALDGMAPDEKVDAIILHAPGTVKGDRSELNAIKALFGNDLPVLISNKWFVGHTFGASAALSLEYALLILANGSHSEFPYPVSFTNRERPLKRIMINAAGFGGNAASLIVTKPAE